jgi:hypothetical protein
MNLSGKNDPSDGEDESVKGISERTKYPYVDYWYCFAELHPSLFKSMNTPFPAGAFTESSSSQPASSICNRGKTRKQVEVYDKLLLQNEFFQEKNLSFQEKIFSHQETKHQQRSAHEERVLTIQESSLAIQKANEKSQRTRDVMAQKQLMALESALHVERVRALEQDIQTGMFDVQKLSKEHSVLKNKFVKHCGSQQVYKERRNGHRERKAARVDNTDSDSDISLDSQAPLMDEIDAVRNRMQQAKKMLQEKQDALCLVGAQQSGQGDEIDDVVRPNKIMLPFESIFIINVATVTF